MYIVTIVYPTDPLGVVPGGTDTCIRDILRCAPSDIEMRLVGVTADPVARPVGRWLDCEVSGKGFKFYPLMSVADLERQMRIPLSAQFTFRLYKDKQNIHCSSTMCVESCPEVGQAYQGTIVL